eukprot:8632513-Prorocentrum_lima.AAC.1
MAKKHAKEVDKDKLLEVFEFVTGLDPDSSTPTYDTFEGYMQFLLRMSDKMGRRAQSLCLPADWSLVGVYLVEFKDGFWHLKNQYLEIE